MLENDYWDLTIVTIINELPLSDLIKKYFSNVWNR